MGSGTSALPIVFNYFLFKERDPSTFSILSTSLPKGWLETLVSVTLLPELFGILQVMMNF